MKTELPRLLFVGLNNFADYIDFSLNFNIISTIMCTFMIHNPFQFQVVIQNIHEEVNSYARRFSFDLIIQE